MIVIPVNGERLALSFSHSKINDPLAQRRTICELLRLNEDGSVDLLAENSADCSRKDNFSRASGRHLALTRTLCQHDYLTKNSTRCMKCSSFRTTTLDLPKDVRTTIWNTYFDSTRSWKRHAQTGQTTN